MKHQIKKAIIKKINIFKGLKRGQVDELLSWFERIEFPEHHQIFREGQESDGLYILCQGSLTVLKGSSKGHFRLAEIDAPSYFGEMGMLSKKHRASTIKCQSPVLVGFLSTALFGMKVRAQNPTALLIGVNLARVLSERLFDADQEIARLTAKVARKRLKKTAASAASSKAPRSVRVKKKIGASRVKKKVRR